MGDREHGLVSSGVPGLDDILRGGFTPGRMYLLQGGPGAGKTTLSMQFLLAGVRRGEKCLFIGIGGAGEEIAEMAKGHGWNLDERYMFVHEVEISEEMTEGPTLRVFHPSEVELGETMKGIFDAVERYEPERIVVDSLAELRLLAEDPLSYRRQILALKRRLPAGGRTVLLTDYGIAESEDLQLQAITHGAIVMEKIPHGFGPLRRQMHISKFRGRRVRGGQHDFIIKTGGIEVFPALVAAEHRRRFPRENVGSGIAELDALLGGGLNKGSSTAILGPAGSGKSTIASQFAAAAAGRGEKSAIYLFDESLESFIERSEGIGIPMETYLDDGRVMLRPIDIAEMSPGEFVSLIREEVESQGVSVVLIDSLSGYLNAMPNEQYLVVHLHDLMSYLGQKGATTLVTVSQHGVIGALQQPVDVSYLADTVLLLRYFELRGEVRRALSVLKKRRGKHEKSIREVFISEKGIAFSEPLREMQGILSGIPDIVQGRGHAEQG